MKPPAGSAEVGGPPSQSLNKSDDTLTGLPLLHGWRGVYWFVIGSFILWVILLAVLGWIYS